MRLTEIKRWHIYLAIGCAFLAAYLLFLFFLFFPAKEEIAPLGKADFSLAVSATPTSTPVAAKREKPAKFPVKGIYLTAYSAGSQKKIDSVIKQAKDTKINAVVIDIKDYTGYLAYDSRIGLVTELKLKEVKIKDVPGLIKNLHDNGLYAIARIAVFQDPALATRKTEWAVLNSATGGVWRDRKGLAWLDPANPEVWDYHVEIAREAIGLGFDEVNLDYIRFPTDGKLSVMKFPKWTSGTKAEVIRNFFKHFHEGLKDEPAYISADLFGLTTTVTNDMNIGQILEDAAPYFDYICPMVYPSHYPSGYMKFSNPASHPYEIIYKAVKTANDRLATTTDSIAEIRPWLQDFNMGATYTADMIKKEIKATHDASSTGWLIWDPKNLYTWAAYK